MRTDRRTDRNNGANNRFSIFRYQNNCFDVFFYFLLQNGVKGLTTGSKVHVRPSDQNIKITNFKISVSTTFHTSFFMMVQRV